MADLPAFKSRVHELPDSPEAVLAFITERRWGDGLPVIPPTAERVAAMIEPSGRAPDEVVGVLGPVDADVTVEKVAINAVMAGCLPAYLPVVLAAIEGVIDPAFNARSVQATTNPVAVMAVVNGPIRHALDINCRRGCLGPGWRANATIGRAIRLVLINVGGGLPGEVDKAVHGMPGKYTFCFGEDEEGSPWEPLHVERGFDRATSTVTVCAIQDMVNSLTTGVVKSETLLKIAAPVLATPANNNTMSGGGEPVLLITRGHAEMLARDGFTKASCRQYLYEHATVPVEALGDAEYPGKPFQPVDGLLRPLRRPEDLMILVAGGDEHYHHQVMHTFGEDTKSITRAIQPIQ